MIAEHDAFRNDAKRVGTSFGKQNSRKECQGNVSVYFWQTKNFFPPKKPFASLHLFLMMASPSPSKKRSAPELGHRQSRVVPVPVSIHPGRRHLALHPLNPSKPNIKPVVSPTKLVCTTIPSPTTTPKPSPSYPLCSVSLTPPPFDSIASQIFEQTKEIHRRLNQLRELYRGRPFFAFLPSFPPILGHPDPHETSDAAVFSLSC